MSTSSDGAPKRPVSPALGASAPSRRTLGEMVPVVKATVRRPVRAAAAAIGRPAASGGGAAASGRGAAGVRRRHGAGMLSIAIAVVTVPLSFFIWYQLISLGAYPGDQVVGDLIMGVVYTAVVHALLLAGILLGVSSIRARRREGRIPIAGWIGIVLNALVLVYWELLVSPWLVALWNRAVGA